MSPSGTGDGIPDGEVALASDVVCGSCADDLVLYGDVELEPAPWHPEDEAQVKPPIDHVNGHSPSSWTSRPKQCSKYLRVSIAQCNMSSS